MSHAAKVETALADLTTAITADDRPAAYAAFADAWVSAVACHKAKSSATARAATATSTSADADVVTACDACTAALASVTPASAFANPSAVGGPFDSLWEVFATRVVPSLLEWAKGLFGGGGSTAAVPTATP